MSSTADDAVAIVGVGAILPDAPDAGAFWHNVTRRAATRSATSTRPAGTPRSTTTPTRRRPTKTYSKIGGWVRDWEWDPLGWKLPIPPKVADAMDDGQKWAVACTRMALADCGLARARARPRAHRGDPRQRDGRREALPDQPAHRLPRARPRARAAPRASPRCRPTCAPRSRASCTATSTPGCREITEDTMPGELANCIAGRVANLFNLRGPNFTVDAACASAMAAHGRGDRGARRARVRRRHHRRRRPQHGRVERS